MIWSKPAVDVKLRLSASESLTPWPPKWSKLAQLAVLPKLQWSTRSLNPAWSSATSSSVSSLTHSTTADSTRAAFPYINRFSRSTSVTDSLTLPQDSRPTRTSSTNLAQRLSHSSVYPWQIRSNLLSYVCLLYPIHCLHSGGSFIGFYSLTSFFFCWSPPDIWDLRNRCLIVWGFSLSQKHGY